MAAHFSPTRKVRQLSFKGSEEVQVGSSKLSVHRLIAVQSGPMAGALLIEQKDEELRVDRGCVVSLLDLRVV